MTDCRSWHAFDLFDPSLGELNSVEVGLTGFLTLQLVVIPFVTPAGLLPKWT